MNLWLWVLGFYVVGWAWLVHAILTAPQIEDSDADLVDAYLRRIEPSMPKLSHHT